MTDTTKHPANPALTQHLVVDFFGVSPSLTASAEGVLETARRAFEVASPPIRELHCSGTEGRVSLVILSPTVHLALHACPDQQYVACDLFASRFFNVNHVCDRLVEAFKPTMIRKTVLHRGLIE